MGNHPRTSLFVIIKGNGFSKLKGFKKNDHFACKLAQFTFPIKRQHFGIQKFKTIRGKKIRTNNLHLICFN